MAKRNGYAKYCTCQLALNMVVRSHKPPLNGCFIYCVTIGFLQLYRKQKKKKKSVLLSWIFLTGISGCIEHKRVIKEVMRNPKTVYLTCSTLKISFGVYFRTSLLRALRGTSTKRIYSSCVSSVYTGSYII